MKLKPAYAPLLCLMLNDAVWAHSCAMSGALQKLPTHRHAKKQELKVKKKLAKKNKATKWRGDRLT